MRKIRRRKQLSEWADGQLGRLTVPDSNWLQLFAETLGQDEFTLAVLYGLNADQHLVRNHDARSFRLTSTRDFERTYGVQVDVRFENCVLFAFSPLVFSFRRSKVKR